MEKQNTVPFSHRAIWDALTNTDTTKRGYKVANCCNSVVETRKSNDHSKLEPISVILNPNVHTTLESFSAALVERELQLPDCLAFSLHKDHELTQLRLALFKAENRAAQAENKAAIEKLRADEFKKRAEDAEKEVVRLEGVIRQNKEISKINEKINEGYKCRSGFLKE